MSQAGVFVALVGWFQWAAHADEHAAYAYERHGAVVHVIDGDTVRLRDRDQRLYMIRLAGIDAPEIGNRQRHPGQPFSRAARRSLEELVSGRRLKVKCYEIDAYGRDVCDLGFPDGGTASQAMVRAGMAWANRQFGDKYLRDPVLPRLEREARERARGLWSAPGPVAPWVWRQRCWNQGHCGQHRVPR